MKGSVRMHGVEICCGRDVVEAHCFWSVVSV